jgi:hypothetical protein
MLDMSKVPPPTAGAVDRHIAKLAALAASRANTADRVRRDAECSAARKYAEVAR